MLAVMVIVLVKVELSVVVPFCGVVAEDVSPPVPEVIEEVVELPYGWL